MDIIEIFLGLFKYCDHKQATCKMCSLFWFDKRLYKILEDNLGSLCTLFYYLKTNVMFKFKPKECLNLLT